MLKTRYSFLKPAGFEDLELTVHICRQSGQVRIEEDVAALLNQEEHQKVLIQGNRKSPLHAVFQANRLYLSLAGDHFVLEEKPSWIDLMEDEEHGGEIHARMPSKVLQVHASKDQRVKAGELLFILESMKMETRIEAPFDAVVLEVLAEEGQMLAADQLMIRLEKTE